MDEKVMMIQVPTIIGAVMVSDTEDVGKEGEPLIAIIVFDLDHMAVAGGFLSLQAADGLRAQLTKYINAARQRIN